MTNKANYTTLNTGKAPLLKVNLLAVKNGQSSTVKNELTDNEQQEKLHCQLHSMQCQQ